MDFTSDTRENYLKAIFKLCEKTGEPTSTNAVSHMLKTSPASVTDMLKKLAEKKLVNHVKYKGVSLTASGTKEAIKIIRKHRLWEFFLVDKLGFSWEEVHNVAEQLEHIKSPILVKRLDQYLGHPRFDPHGGPIPDHNGKIKPQVSVRLSKLKAGSSASIVGVEEDSAHFLNYLNSIKIAIGTKVKVLEHIEYDDSMVISIGKNPVTISSKVSGNIYVKAMQK